ncbi:type-F conjugative transfer system protein TraW [Vibrio parahaemolyticus]|nr:type-F conjugative transfer system protein TraW [Vibrio parahaemolyticus]EKG9663422.1 type-F conjugative transfer system protein TraW [Vibrio parahaemolyticus]EKG9669002.1 type-F conjugative transfer system protein TraW [Vibrio parahaemolyticus]
MTALALWGAALLFQPHAGAKDLGRIGATFPIGEIDMLVWIKQRLKGFEQSGKLASMQQEFAQRVAESVETPPPLTLTTTTTPSSFFVDPSLTLARDLSYAKGQIFAKAGIRINPFDTNTWPEQSRPPNQFEYSHVLIFFDARDEQQIAFAQTFESTKPIKWVLTGGSPNAVAERLNSRIYFDQQGDLSKKMHIKAVPSLVEQSGINWKVTEFDVSNEEPKP